MKRKGKKYEKKKMNEEEEGWVENKEWEGVIKKCVG